jgi:hypothetical protein
MKIMRQADYIFNGCANKKKPSTAATNGNRNRHFYVYGYFPSSVKSQFYAANSASLVLPLQIATGKKGAVVLLRPLA